MIYFCRHFSKPNVPDIPGLQNFSGSILHSHFYRVPDNYRDKDVIVLGARSSGRDIAVEIASVARTVLLSHRTSPLECVMPANVTQKPSMKAIDDDGKVIFEDGSSSSSDAIVFCTGYQFEFPFLDESCNIQVQNSRVSPLYKQIFNINYPSMAFIGLPSIVCPNQLFSLQARWIFNVLSGRTSLPTSHNMLEDEKADLESKLSAGISEGYFHRFDEGKQWDYYKMVSDLGDVEPMKHVVKKLYMLVGKERSDNLLTYREVEYRVINDEDFERVI